MARPTDAQRAALARIGDERGRIAGAAVDHRDALQRMLASRGLELDHAALVDLKLDLLRALSPHATMVLIDVEHGAERALAEGAIDPRCGVAIPLEAQGYGQLHEIGETTLLDDVDPERIRALGGHAAKLLLPYRVDDAVQAARQDAVVERVAAACADAGIAFLLEPVAYPRPDEQRAGDERFGELVVAGAARLAAFGPTILKVQYPGSATACRLLDEACGEVPWALLGGGEAPDALVAQVEEACAAGARGAIVGRTLFDGALTADAEARERALAIDAPALLARLRRAARA